MEFSHIILAWYSLKTSSNNVVIYIFRKFTNNTALPVTLIIGRDKWTSKSSIRYHINFMQCLTSHDLLQSTPLILLLCFLASLSFLPDNFGDLKNLIMLDISGNNLKWLPESLVNLTNLRFLECGFLMYHTIFSTPKVKQNQD